MAKSWPSTVGLKGARADADDDDDEETPKADEWISKQHIHRYYLR
jgi:hypothetical protein